MVAVGDIHGAFDNFVAILRAAQVIDNRNRWIGGRTVLVQTGDILDRGPDSRKAIDLLRRLERDAQRAGGRVVSLLGNHELMRLISDWRYVSAERSTRSGTAILPSFGNRSSRRSTSRRHRRRRPKGAFMTPPRIGSSS